MVFALKEQGTRKCRSPREETQIVPAQEEAANSCRCSQEANLEANLEAHLEIHLEARCT